MYVSFSPEYRINPNPKATKTIAQMFFSFEGLIISRIRKKTYNEITTSSVIEDMVNKGTENEIFIPEY